MKRLLDIIASAIFLTLFLPFGLLIAVVLRFTGEGEVLYVQPRVGKGRKIFGLYKLVTMMKDSENMDSGTITLKNDPRVLPVGRYLRKAKLNEFPQFLNVLKGDMSLVGPRPMTPETFGYYPKEAQDRIGQMQPGITGVASIVFRDEESIIARSPKSAIDCYCEDVAPYKAELELWYQENRSLWLDLKLLLLTAIVLAAPSSQIYYRLLPDLPQPSDGGLL